MVLFEIIAATIAVSLVSLAGVIFLGLNEKNVGKFIHFLISLAAGTLLGDVFIHLIPEASEGVGTETALLFVLAGFVGFFIVEKLLIWHHCREKKCEVQEAKTTPKMILLGDGIHNFLDGAIIATSFVADPALGVFTAIAVVLHEVPQEIGDFAVLLHGGIKKSRALFYNFLSALTAVAGGLFTYFFLSASENLITALLPIAGGGLLYIASSDLIPELHKETRIWKNVLLIATLLAGIAIMYYLKAFG